MEAGALTARTIGAFLVASWPRRISLGILLLIPVVVAALGGFDRDERVSSELPAGEWVDLGAYAVRVDSYFVSDQVQTYWLDDDDPDDAMVGVVLDVEVLQDEPVDLQFEFEAVVPVLDEAIFVGTGSSADTSVLVADATTPGQVMPGLPAQVALLWHVSDGSAVGDEMTVQLTSSEYVYSMMRDDEAWIAIGDVWSVEAARTDPPARIVEPEDEL